MMAMRVAGHSATFVPRNQTAVDCITSTFNETQVKTFNPVTGPQRMACMRAYLVLSTLLFITPIKHLTYKSPKGIIIHITLFMEVGALL